MKTIQTISLTDGQRSAVGKIFLRRGIISLTSKKIAIFASVTGALMLWAGIMTDNHRMAVAQSGSSPPVSSTGSFARQPAPPVKRVITDNSTISNFQSFQLQIKKNRRYGKEYFN